METKRKKKRWKYYTKIKWEEKNINKTKESLRKNK